MEKGSFEFLEDWDGLMIIADQKQFLSIGHFLHEALRYVEKTREVGFNVLYTGTGRIASGEDEWRFIGFSGEDPWDGDEESFEELEVYTCKIIGYEE
jgi:hypothetical protein